MGKPSLLQTLLRQPSQSYANSYDPSTSRRIGSSSGSRSSDGGHDDERNGTGWAWSSFSGRTSGGGGSVRSSVGGRGREEDDRSLRSSKSLGSLRSQSTQRSYGNGASWTSEGGSVREGKARAKAGRSERTSRVYGETQPLPVRYEQEEEEAEEEEVPQQTSRRYSTIVDTAAVATPIISITSSSPTSPRSFPLPDEPSPSAHTSTVDWSPSLSSSSSTSGSSTPSTPVLSSPEMVYTSISASSTRLEQIQEESQRGQIRRQLYSGTYGLDPVPEDTEDEGEDRKVIRTLDRAVSLDGERMQMWKQERDRPRSTRVSRTVLHEEPLTDEHPQNPSTIPLPFSPSVAPLLEADEPNTRPGSPVELPPTVRPEAVSLPESPPLTTNKVFSMDEVFGDLPFPTDLLCTPTSSSVEFTVVATTAQIITVSPASPLASVLALVEPSTIPLPPSPLLIPTPTFPSPAVEPILPTPPKEYRSISAAHKRLSMSLLPYASSDESSIRSGTDVSSPATEVTMSDGTSSRKSLAKYKVANVPAHALSNGSTTPPRRPSPSKSSRPKSMSSFNPASQSPPQISYDIISSSKLTAANLTSSSGTRAVPDTPEWLRNIRALGEPIQPLIIQKSSLNRRHSSLSTKSTAIVRDPPTAALSSYASRASLRVPRNVMPTMLEDQEVLADDTRWSTPSHSPGGSVVGRGEATIPRRRTQSAAEAPTLIFPPLPPGVIDNTPVPSLDVPHASSTMRERKRPVSIFSVTSLGGQSTHSISGLSTMSVPVGAYRPVKTPNRFSLGSETIVQSSATMSALSISANATAALQNSSRLFSRFGKKADVLPPHLAHRFDPARDLTFGGLRPPPTKLRSDEVLVEVHAVGVDQWDYARVVEMGSKPEGFGWIPGRSFCGRALECGAEVSKIKRGDFVFGLNELKKVS